jgi:hypothetical protein
MMRSFRSVFVAVALTLAFGNPCCAQSTPVDPEEQVTKTAVYTLGPTRIEQKKISTMQGPTLEQDISLGKDPLASTVWLKSLEVETLGEQGSIKTAEFICHAGLRMKDLKSDSKKSSGWLRTLGRGVVLPVGYGMRLDNLKLSPFLLVQTMNPNAVPAFNVKYRFTVRYIEDEDAKKLRLKNISDVHMAIFRKNAETQNHRAVPSPNNHETQADPDQCSDTDEDPFMFMVPPGQHAYLRVLDRHHPIYKGGRIIVYARHMHIYGRSVDLIDQTTHEMVGGPTPNVDNLEDTPARNILLKFDKGIPIDPSHTYAIGAVYDNPTNAPISGMALIHLYVADE